jgi:hypothetical protein
MVRRRYTSTEGWRADKEESAEEEGAVEEGEEAEVAEEEVGEEKGGSGEAAEAAGSGGGSRKRPRLDGMPSFAPAAAAAAAAAASVGSAAAEVAAVARDALFPAALRAAVETTWVQRTSADLLRASLPCMNHRHVVGLPHCQGGRGLRDVLHRPGARGHAGHLRLGLRRRPLRLVGKELSLCTLVPACPHAHAQFLVTSLTLCACLWTTTVLFFAFFAPRPLGRRCGPLHPFWTTTQASAASRKQCLTKGLRRRSPRWVRGPRKIAGTLFKTRWGCLLCRHLLSDNNRLCCVLFFVCV